MVHGGHGRADRPPDLRRDIKEFPVPTPPNQPLFITSGADGNLWFTEIEGTRSDASRSTGEITEFPLPNVHSEPA